MTTRLIAALAATIALSASAHADILLAARNSAFVAVPVNGGSFALDGKATKLTFTTTKPNEQVEISFSTACSLALSTQPSSSSTTASITVAMEFVLDGTALTDGSLPEIICAASLPASTVGSFLLNAVDVRRVQTLATPGKHSLAILFGTFGETNATGQLGQSHTVVSN